ncbi:MAG TPA: metallophosphoesterase family protein, partial [Candidatus Limnocylindria bacterium]|nr:metallophosphoesterase family protein [Candidatus Limnocylindria bacterium]
MTVALLSDVHANLVALEAVLAELPAVDAIWVMGDTVGYGPDPADTLALLRERRASLVAGNHDRAAATGEGLELFN